VQHRPLRQHRRFVFAADRYICRAAIVANGNLPFVSIG
jgi:hypothetical protein